ncbi:MAG: PASTA domain-containing protein [Mycobacteriaceae bacterium]
MRRTVLFMTVAGALTALTACGPAATDTSSSPTTDTMAESTSAAVSTTAAAPTSAVTTQAPTSAAFAAFAMPRFVGMDLQSAQNAVQTHRIFYSKSHDLRGSRHQILDSDWIVCTQNLPPGQQVTSDIEGQIDFGVVKRSETCP